jgi:hypothetical protein
MDETIKILNMSQAECYAIWAKLQGQRTGGGMSIGEIEQEAIWKFLEKNEYDPPVDKELFDAVLLIDEEYVRLVIEKQDKDKRVQELGSKRFKSSR